MSKTQSSLFSSPRLLSCEEKVNALLEFVTNENIAPKRSKEIIVDGIKFKIGRFWNCIKKGLYEEYLPRLLENSILREAYENKELKDKEVMNTKNVQCKVSLEQKINSLMNFVVNENRAPKLSENDDNCKIGQFWHDVKHGKYKKCKNLLPRLLENPILKDAYEEYLLHKRKKKSAHTRSKNLLSIEERVNAFLDFVNKQDRIPKYYEKITVKNTEFKIGKFFYKITEDEYKEYLPRLLENPIVKEKYEYCFGKIETHKRKLSINEKINCLLSFVNRENRAPRFSESVTLNDIDFKVGVFWDGIKNGYDKNYLYYLRHLECMSFSQVLENSILKQEYNKSE